jgi:hypothetical protein
MVPRSYSTITDLDRRNQIVLDASDHGSEGLYDNANPISYYRNCQDVIDSIPRQPLAEMVWSSIHYVDFKLSQWTHHKQIQDLKHILMNPQPQHVLHLVAFDVEFDRAIDMIQSLTWSNQLILDIHSVHAREHIQLQVSQLASLDLAQFMTLDYHYVYNNREAVYIHMTGDQRLRFYDPEANRSDRDGSVRYSHIMRK